jgi:hypothetical protein
MLGRPANLPESLIGFPPVRDCGLDLPHQHRPASLIQTVAGSGVQVNRVEQDAPHIVLALVPRAVADPDRASAVVTGQVIERVFGQLTLAADPVHDLEIRIVLGEVGEEVEEVVRFPIQPQRVQAP